jgi:hypothetical protein
VNRYTFNGVDTLMELFSLKNLIIFSGVGGSKIPFNNNLYNAIMKLDMTEYVGI